MASLSRALLPSRLLVIFVATVVSTVNRISGLIREQTRGVDWPAAATVNNSFNLKDTLKTGLGGYKHTDLKQYYGPINCRRSAVNDYRHGLPQVTPAFSMLPTAFLPRGVVDSSITSAGKSARIVPLIKHTQCKRG